MGRPTNTEARRRQISRALVTVMAHRGYDGASIADIAAAARLTPGLVHYHFASKLEILLAVLARLAATHGEKLDRAIAAADGDPDAELAAFVDVHLALGDDADPDALATWVALSAEALRRPEVKAGWQGVVTAIVDRLEGILRRVVRAHRLRRADTRSGAVALVAAIQGYYVLAAAGGDLVPRGTAAASVRRMAAGLLQEGVHV